MAAAAILMRLGPPYTVCQNYFTNLKILEGGGNHFEKSKNLHIFAID